MPASSTVRDGAVLSDGGVALGGVVTLGELAAGFTLRDCDDGMDVLEESANVSQVDGGVDLADDCVDGSVDPVANVSC